MKKLLAVLCVILSTSLFTLCNAQYDTIYNFNGTLGTLPNGSLTLVGNKLYGLASTGGANSDGCVFSVNLNGTNYKDLFDFGSTNGTYPYGSLVLLGNKLYGMTSQGGTPGDGCVFSIDTSGSAFKVLLNFSGANGSSPQGSLVILGKKLFGMTGIGSSGNGNIFSLDTNGGGFKNLLIFTGTNGANPYGDLTIIGNRLYGMTGEGGAHSDGIIFSIDTGGTGFKDMYDFNGTAGESPTGDLLVVGQKFYGMTGYGGAHSDGVIFSIDTNGSAYTDMLDFTSTNGREPRANLTLYGNTLYGMTLYGGTHSWGTIISIDTNGSGFTDLLNFGNSVVPIGSYPNGSLTLVGNTFYGLAGSGGPVYDGLIFKYTPSCTLSSFSITATNVSCYGGNNGSATANPSGGITPYTYLWNDANSQTTVTATGLIAGTYTVNVTDNNGCTGSASVSITRPSELRDSVKVTDVACNGGTGHAVAHVGGGMSPYTYMWSDGQTKSAATGLVAGTYSVSIKDACGADSIVNFTITQPSELRDSLSYTNITCNGGTVSATAYVGGGSPPYKYAWSDVNNQTTATATGLVAGTYSVSIKDICGADSTLSFTITQPSELRDSINITSTILCNGGTVSATANVTGGNSPYTYLWSDANSQTTATATGLVAGTYSVSIQDACGADSIVNITITQPGELMDSVTVTNAGCSGATGSATANVSGGNSPYTYLWSDANSQTTATATGLVAGTYSVSIKDACGADSVVNITIVPLSELRDSVKVTDVACNGGTGHAVAHVGGGMSPYTYMWSDGQTKSAATGLVAGTYSVSIKDACGADSIVNFTITQPSELRDSLSYTNITCNGGTVSATAYVGGGSPPYKYAWSDVNNQTTATATGLVAGTYSVSIKDICGADSTLSFTITQPSELRDSINITSTILCNGGTVSATANVTGGNSPYTYLWSDANSQTTATATGLVAGTYSVSIQDACGADSIVNITITQPGELMDSVTVTNAGCSGATGSATANVSGGNSPYTYLWSDANSQTTATATGLVAGTYSVSIKDACGADSVVNITIVPLSELRDSVKVTDVACNGGTGHAVAHVGGGMSPYTYMWSDGQTKSAATGLVAGTYSVSIKDACGADSIVNFTITQPSELRDSLSYTNITCNGGTVSAIISAGGGSSPYTYLWSDANSQTTATATGLLAGTYSVSIQDVCGADSTLSFTITQPSELRDSVNISGTILCNGGTVSATANATGGNSPYTYLWSDANSQTTVTATGLVAGTYSVSIQDACGADSVVNITITQPSELRDSVSATNITCNGGVGSATANVTGGNAPYTYLWSDANSQTTATATGLVAGTYSVSIKDACGADSMASVVITQPNMLSNTAATVVDNISCNGGNNGSASVSPSGGSLPYTYLWSDASSQATAKATGLIAGTYTVNIKDACGADSVASVILTQPSAIAISINSTAITCNGGNNGSATSAVSGGTSAYTYAWSPSGGSNSTSSGLSAGTYTLTITDNNGCSNSATVNISQPSAISISTVITDVVCNGGNNGDIAATVSGGTSPYTYSWSPAEGSNSDASGLTAGTYTLGVMDNNGCSNSATITITQPGILSASASATDIACNGGNNGIASSLVSGGASPYTYSWSPGGETNANATGLSIGTYTVTVSDACGNISTASVTITQPNSLGAVASITASVSCNGGNNGSSLATTSGGTLPYTYSWSPSGGINANATGLIAGTYTVTVTDACGSSVTSDVEIPEPAALNVTADSVADNGSTNGSISVIVSGGLSPYTYSWSPGGATTSSISGLSAGKYCCTITDANHCTYSICDTVKSTVGIDNLSNSSSIKIYPDPTIGNFTVTGVIQGQVIELYNYLGEKLSSTIASDATMHFNISDQANGIYLIRILNTDGTLVTEKKMIKTE